MKLSAPVYILKQQAKLLSRREKIPLHQALNRIARQEGYSEWSLLAASLASANPATSLLSELCAGELALLGSRPGQGKTLLSLGLAVEAMRRGGHAAFFTLDFTRADVAARLSVIGADPGAFGDQLLVDDSDEICADYIVARLDSAPPNTLVIVDYLQLLDQNRERPDLTQQVRVLRAFARRRQLIVVCLSQIDRRYDVSQREFPGVADVRLPNPLDLRLFDRTCFLNQGAMQVGNG